MGRFGSGNGAFNKYTGQQGGGMSGGNTGGGGGSDYFGQAGDKLGFGTKKQDAAADSMSGNANAMYGDSQGVLSHMKDSDSKYLGDSIAFHDSYESGLNDAVGKWKTKNDQLMSDSEQQGKDASAAYTNTILPKMKDNMESAMTLKQAQDPNNSVATATRGMYNTQAQGIQNQGTTDYGVLAALGSQATANTMGNGMPMTGGQISSLQGQNMGQASQAFSNAQNYANNLKLQGIQAGQDQSNWAYGKGQQAGQDYQGALHNNQMQQQGYRGEQSDMNAGNFQANMAQPTDAYKFNMGYAGTEHGFAQNQGNQQLSAIGQKYGVQNAALGMKANAAGAQNAGKMGILASGIGAVGNAMGGMMGGGKGGGGGGGGGGPQGPGASSTETQPDNRTGNTDTEGNLDTGGQNTSDQSSGGGGNRFDGGSGNGMSTALYGGQQDYNGGQGGGVGSYMGQQQQQNPYAQQQNQRGQRRAYA